MINILEKIQNKPEGFKKTVMWFGVFFVMAVIFTFWISTFPSSISSSGNGGNNFNADKLPGVWDSIKGQLNELENLFYSKF